MKRATLDAYDEVALVLQGGGALGSYQAGVIEGLAEAGIEPNWVAGISIGAINAAIVAGNPIGERLARINAFWRDICRQPGMLAESVVPELEAWPEPLQSWRTQWAAWSALSMGQNGFFRPRLNPPWWPGLGQADSASWYDTSALRHTLEQVVDFDRINAGETRVSVGAVTSYTFTNVLANHTISASFAINTFTITATAGTNGSIAPSGAVTVIGRSTPSLFGTSGESTAFTP